MQGSRAIRSIIRDVPRGDKEGYLELNVSLPGGVRDPSFWRATSMREICADSELEPVSDNEEHGGVCNPKF